jgi:hypothetical protein
MKIEFPDPKHPDMSPEAILERLRMVEALRRLGVALKEAGERGPIDFPALRTESVESTGDARSQTQ